MELEHHLAVLRAVEAVSGCKDFGVEGDTSRQFGVEFYIRTAPGAAGRKKVRVACSEFFPTKIDAALEGRRRVRDALGDAALEAAETLVRARAAAGSSAAGSSSAGSSSAGSSAPSNEELEWLAMWMDAQPDPSEITHAQAEAALLQHPLIQKCGGSLTGSWTLRLAGIAQVHKA